MSAVPSIVPIKAPPHSVEAEQCVIGGLLIDNGAYDRIASQIKDADFYRADHRVIWRELVRMIEAGRVANVVTLYEALQSAGKAEDVGGLVYLNNLAQNTPGASGIREYARIVRERSVRRGLLVLADEAAEMAYDRSKADVEQIVLHIEERAFALAQEGVLDDGELPLPADVMPSIRDAIQERIENGGAAMGLETGLVDLDRATLGLHAGQFIVVAGRPGMGKTSLALQAGSSVTKAGGTVLVFSMEMGREELLMRELAGEARVDLMRIRSGQLDDSEIERIEKAQARLSKLKLLVDERPALSVGQMRSRARRVKRRHGLDLIIVDHIGLARGVGDNRTQEIGSISRGMKSLAKEFNVPVIGLSQLNRGVESRSNKRPMMSDLRESGDIEQDADVILFLYRDEYYNPDNEASKGIAEIDVAKQRNGPVKRIEVTFIGEYTRFENLVRPWGWSAPPMPKVAPRKGFQD